MANESTAARPYARAIFELASERGDYSTWSDRLAFWAAVVADPDMRDRLVRPGLTAADKAALMVEVSEGLDEDSRNLLRLLAENERLVVLPDIHEQFEAQRREAEGEIEAHVISAYPLDDSQRERIVEALGARLARKVKLTSEVDEALLGGAIVRAGDLVIDGSVRGRLADLERSVTA